MSDATQILFVASGTDIKYGMFLIGKIRDFAVKFFRTFRSCAALLALALPFSTQLSARQQQSVQQPLSPGTVSGHIYRSDSGAPLPKASVTLNIAQVNTATSQILPQTVRTDSSGAFQFTQVAPGRYTARADHIGFVAAGYGEDPTKQIPMSPFTVAPGQNLVKIDITLGAAGIISGNISDDDNDPVENVQVSAIRMRYARGGARQEVQMRTVSTDDQGNYRLFGLVPGFYFVRASGNSMNGTLILSGPAATGPQPTYYPGTGQIDTAQRVQVVAGTETSGIRFSVGTQMTHKITGTITDSTGSSESRRFIVRLSRGSPDGQVSGPISQVANVSNQDGSFTLNGVPSGDYTINAQSLVTGQPTGPSVGPPEINTGYARVRINDADVQVNITVTGPSEIKGKAIVAGTQGPAAQGVRITLHSPPGESQFMVGQTALVDATGNFDFRSVAQGEYNFDVQIPSQSPPYLMQVTCGSKDYTLQTLAIESPITLSDCVVTLGADAGSISGQVMDSNGPVQGLVVVAIPETPALRSLPRFTTTARTDENGQYSLTGVIPGDYFVFAVAYNDEQTYFAPDFAETNISDAERVTVHPNDAKTVNPKPSAAH